MKSIIYYFTGTGNSLHIGRELANGIENCELKEITTAMGERLEPMDIVGIVCPNYSYDVPHIVGDFIKKIKKHKTYNYLFVTVSSGGEFGYVTDNIIKRFRGGNINSIFQHFMPFNYLPFGDVPDKETRNKMFIDLKRDLSSNLETIKKRESVIQDKKGPLSKKMKHIFALAHPMIPQLDRTFKVSNNCDGCGICEKVCAANNIRLKKGKPKWNHRCQQCFACVHWCPKEAVLAGKKSISQERYQHPEVKLKDLIVR